MNDDGIVRRTALDFVNARDGARIERIGGQAVNRFRRQRDDLARVEDFRGALDGSVEQPRRVRGENLGAHRTRRKCEWGNVQHPTSNVELSTKRNGVPLDVGCWMLVVGCFNSLIPQRINGIELRRFARRIKTKENSDRRAEGECDNNGFSRNKRGPTGG